MVRWYKPKELTPGKRDVLVEHEFKKLTWVTGREAVPVVALSSIVRRVYIVPDFSTWSGAGEPQVFHLSKSKWDRMAKDDSQKML